MQSNSSTQKLPTSTQHNLVQPNLAPMDLLSATLAIAFPVLVILAIVGYQKYQTIVLQRQIKHLNKLWQLNSSQKLS